MKKSILILLLSFSTIPIFSQKIIYGPEMVIRVTNFNPDSSQFTYSITKESMSYCYIISDITEILECSDCGSLCDECDGGWNQIPQGGFDGDGNGAGFCTHSDYPIIEFGYGVYKLIHNGNNENTEFIFIDTRDARYSREELNSSLTYEGYNDDFRIRYNGLGYFELDGCKDGNYEYQVPFGGVMQIWKGTWKIIIDEDEYYYKSFNSPDVNPFPQTGNTAFWQNCLAIGTHPYLSPQIIWSRKPNWFNSRYYLYREINGNGFTKIGDFNNITYNFHDKSIIYSEESDYVKYKVTSYNGSTESGFTNTSEPLYISFNWSEGLILTQNNNDKVKLVWVPNPSFTTTHFKIYRALSENPVNPLSLTFNLIFTVSSSTYSIIDPDITIDSTPDKYAYYYVKAYNSNTNTYSSKTNIENVAGDYLPQKRGTTKKASFDFLLSQNYPNPFNPTTEISYSIANDGFVNLTVYDILGRVTAVLVNEEKPAGNYKVNFNASHLSSGIYFYKLTSSYPSTSSGQGFISIKKLNVLK